MQVNGTPTMDSPAAGVETAPYPLNYGEITVALYVSDVSTGTRLADLAAQVAAVVARLGLAEVATRAKRLQRADLAAGTRGDRHAHDGYRGTRLEWARLAGFTPLRAAGVPTVAVPLAFYDDVAALWGWEDRYHALMADPMCDHQRAAAIRAEVPADAIKATRARGLELSATAETLVFASSLRERGRWATLRFAVACSHPLLSATPDGTVR